MNALVVGDDARQVVDVGRSFRVQHPDGLLPGLGIAALQIFEGLGDSHRFPVCSLGQEEIAALGVVGA